MTRFFKQVDDQDHVQGSPIASVTLVEYGDYQCPYCGQAYPILKQAARTMGDRMRFVFRNFPLTEMHPNALPAAQFAEAAASVGKFWQAHDLLYENQDALGEADLFRYASGLGLPHSLLQQALAGRFDEKIAADFQGGLRSGVNGTPSLFIDGHRYDGERDAASIIDALELANLQHVRPRD